MAEPVGRQAWVDDRFLLPSLSPAELSWQHRDILSSE